MEHSDLSEITTTWQDFVQAEADLQTANELLSDPEMKEMALDEIEVARANIETLEERLNVMMLPKDPNDKATAFFGDSCRHGR